MMETLSRIGDFNAALSQYDQCYQILVDELDVEPMPETTELYRRIQAARAARRHNLPPESTPFIGRAKELEQLIAMVSEPDCRLVTIVGLGGIGKSRLALQAARQICAEQALLFLNGLFMYR
ncbi:AAA family ATPase [Chloroflexi bacterium TSY]|nr:AAA family ATPase [Chloroflexi bacterium TSY]